MHIHAVFACILFYWNSVFLECKLHWDSNCILILHLGWLKLYNHLASACGWMKEVKSQNNRIRQIASKI